MKFLSARRRKNDKRGSKKGWALLARTGALSLSLVILLGSLPILAEEDGQQPDVSIPMVDIETPEEPPEDEQPEDGQPEQAPEEPVQQADPVADPGSTIAPTALHNLTAHDEASLRSAISQIAAQSDRTGTITILNDIELASAITLTYNSGVNLNLTLTGYEGTERLITQGDFPHLSITDRVILTITNIVFDGNYVGGGIRTTNPAGSPFAEIYIKQGAVIQNCSAGSFSAVYLTHGSVYMSGGQIVNNTATTIGGGVMVASNQSFFHMTDGVISGNTGTRGGGIGVGQTAFTKTALIIDGGQIINNRATVNGSAIFSGNGDIEINGGTISGNYVLSGTTSSSWAAIHLDSNASLTINGGTIQDNVSVDGYGRAIYGTNNAIEMNGGTISGHKTSASVGGGGAIYISGSSGSLTIGGDAHIYGNSSANGGAIYTSNSSLTIKDNALIENNSATSNGGAIYLANSSVFSVEEQAIIRNNTSTQTGGAIYAANQATITISGGYFCGNNAMNGGAIYTANYSNLWISGGAFENNVASVGFRYFDMSDSSLVQLYGNQISGITSLSDPFDIQSPEPHLNKVINNYDVYYLGMQTEPPVVHTIYEGDTQVSGTGVPGAALTFYFGGYEFFDMTVPDNGSWTINVPAGVTLTQALTGVIWANQQAEGKRISDSVYPPVLPVEITITKTAYNTGINTDLEKTVGIGNRFNYDIVVTNTRNAPVTVTVTDTMPNGLSIWSSFIEIGPSSVSTPPNSTVPGTDTTDYLWEITVPAAGSEGPGRATIHLEVTVGPYNQIGDLLVNYAKVEESGSMRGSASDVVRVVTAHYDNKPDVEKLAQGVSVEGTKKIAAPGSDFSYTITVINNNRYSMLVDVVDLLPPGLVYLGSTNGGGATLAPNVVNNDFASTTTITWQSIAVAARDAGNNPGRTTITMQVRMQDGLQEDHELVNRVETYFDDSGNNSGVGVPNTPGLIDTESVFVGPPAYTVTVTYVDIDGGDVHPQTTHQVSRGTDFPVPLPSVNNYKAMYYKVGGQKIENLDQPVNIQGDTLIVVYYASTEIKITLSANEIFFYALPQNGGEVRSSVMSIQNESQLAVDVSFKEFDVVDSDGVNFVAEPSGDPYGNEVVFDLVGTVGAFQGKKVADAVGDSGLSPRAYDVELGTLGGRHETYTYSSGSLSLTGQFVGNFPIEAMRPEVKLTFHLSVHNE